LLNSREARHRSALRSTNITPRADASITASILCLTTLPLVESLNRARRQTGLFTIYV
jgi:hypothetical protein